MILVTGATGKIGGALVQLLSEAEQPARALVRGASRAEMPPGVDIAEGSFSDEGSLERAFAGVKRAYLVSPDASLELMAVDAAARAGVELMVKSSALAVGTEPPAGHRAVEERIESSGMAWAHVRPSAFMQTLAAYLPTLIGEDGEFHLPAGEGRTGWVDTRDIAAVGFALLTGRGEASTAYPVTGPEALSMHDVAETASIWLGRKVRYVAAPAQASRQRMVAAGLAPGMADFLVTHYTAVSQGAFDLVTDTVENLSGVPPRRLAELTGFPGPTP